ncbi:hypothetical protein CapIbe_001239 [Capra ibex]
MFQFKVWSFPSCVRTRIIQSLNCNWLLTYLRQRKFPMATYTSVPPETWKNPLTIHEECKRRHQEASWPALDNGKKEKKGREAFQGKKLNHAV